MTETNLRLGSNGTMPTMGHQNQHKYTRMLLQVWNGDDVAHLRLQFAAAFIVFMGVVCLIMNPLGLFSLTGVICTLAAVGVGYYYYLYIEEASTGSGADAVDGSFLDNLLSKPWPTRFALFLLLVLSPLIFFVGSNAVNRARYEDQKLGLLFDRLFLELDNLVLGAFFPRGQVSLLLDQAPLIGVKSFLGRCLTEVLEIAYFSYYFWGNALIVYLAYMYFRGKQVQIPGQPSLTPNQQWRRLVLLLSAWVSAHMLNFLLSLRFPVVSPRVFIADYYENPIRGILFGDMLRSMTTALAANTFSAFPSGRCGLSWLAVSMARAVGIRQYYTASLVAAVLITIGSLFLRYNYAVDIIAAIVLYKFGVFIGFLDSSELFHLAVTQVPTGQPEVSYTGVPASGKVDTNAREDTSDVEGIAVRVLGDEDDVGKSKINGTLESGQKDSARSTLHTQEWSEDELNDSGMAAPSRSHLTLLPQEKYWKLKWVVLAVVMILAVLNVHGYTALRLRAKLANYVPLAPGSTDGLDHIVKMFPCMIEVLDRHGVSWFMDEGSLLGALRNKGIIPGDSDADIGVFAHEKEKINLVWRDWERVCNFYVAHRDQALGWFDPITLYTTRRVFMRIFSSYWGPTWYIDVRDYDMDENRIIYDKDFVDLDDSYFLPVEDILPTVPCPFSGVVAQCPKNTLFVVEELYGPDWRVPKPGFKTTHMERPTPLQLYEKALERIRTVYHREPTHPIPQFVIDLSKR